MSTIVLLASPALIKEMEAVYRPHFVSPFPPYTAFSAKKQGTTISAYNSGKIVLQGTAAEKESEPWLNKGATPQQKKESVSKKDLSTLPSGFSGWSVIGSDEVGTGSYFGPLTVVAAYVEDTAIPLLKELGVQDSKNLSDPQIIRIAKDLVAFLPYSSLSMDPVTYNRIQPTMSQGKMKAILHNRALLNVKEKIVPKQPKAILIDQFAQPSTYYAYLKQEKEILKEDVFFATKGESRHLSVAAASIIARYSFLNGLKEESDAVGITLPSGAGSQSDIVAAKLLKKGGIDLLGKVAKLHFANTEKAKKIAGYR